MYGMPAPEFFSKVWRIGAYGGVVTAIMTLEAEKKSAGSETAGVSGTPDSERQAANGQAGAVAVPFEVFKAAHPDIVSHSTVKEG